MRVFLCFFLFALCGEKCLGYRYGNTNLFCRDLIRQQMIDIQQLGGIWYLIEKIIHTEERREQLNLTTCPVLYIAEEDRDFRYPYSRKPWFEGSTNSYAPGYRYSTQYGQDGQNGYYQQSSRNPTDPKATFADEQDYLRQKEMFDRQTKYESERQNPTDYHRLGEKRLKFFLSDGSAKLMDHHLKYNVTDSGFWVMSGPGEGTQENTRHFAGIIQVLKAVGSHLVLTTCKSQKDPRELYTMVLSRDTSLEHADINSVHGQLMRLGLHTNYIEKSCNSAGLRKFSVFLLGFVMASVHYLS